MFYAYVLYSPKFKRFYKGQTEDLNIRINQHNTGRVKSTKAYTPWEIVYFEKFWQRKDALEREQYFKTAAGRRFLKTKIDLQ